MQTDSVNDRHQIGVALAGLAGLALAIGIGRFSYTAILPMMQADQGLSLVDGSWLALVNLVGYLIGGLTAARFRHQPVLCARLAIGLIVVGMASMAFTDQQWWWTVLRLITGAASAWVMVMLSILCLPELNTRSALAGWVFSGVGTGVALGGLVCLVLVASNLSSETAWVILALLCAALGAVVWHRFPNTAPNPNAPIPHPLNTNPTDTINGHNAQAGNGVDQPRLWRLVFCYGLYGFGYILPATYLPAQARVLLQESWLYSLAWPVFGVAAAVSTLLAAALAHRFGRLPTWVGAHVLMAIGVVLPVFFPNLVAIVLAAMAVGGTFVVITLLAMQEAQRHGGQQAPIWMARLTTAFATGQLFGPLFVMGLGEQLSLSLLLAAGVLLVTAGVLFKQWRQDKK
uniref:YbfB/YjiJ family MFS transporter n=1 Tax=Orrella sp. TaxID=1921583 RepID=UPI0040486622